MLLLRILLLIPIVLMQEDAVKFVDSNSDREGFVSLKTSGIWINVCHGNQATIDAFCRWSGYQLGLPVHSKKTSLKPISGWKFDVICGKNAKSVKDCNVVKCTPNSRLYVRCSGYPGCTLESGLSIPGNSSRILNNRQLCHCGKGGVVSCKCIKRTCPDGNAGDFDKDCNLICKEASETAVIAVNAECHDKLNLGYCVSQKHNCEYIPIKRQCAKTCGVCGQLDSCRDTFDTEICDAWKKREGCTKASVRKVCQKSCEVCQVEDATEELQDDVCEDKYRARTCQIFYDNGQCETSKPIQRWCAKTCGLCKPEVELEEEQPCKNKLGDKTCTFSSSRGSCLTNLKILKGCKFSCGLCEKLTSDNCRDFYNTDSCRIWKTNGLCADDTKVQRYCAETCGICESLQTIEPPIEGDESSDLECKDMADVSLCNFYRTRGFCVIPAYKSLVEQRCPKSCRLCGEKCADKISTVTCQKWRNYGSCENNTSVREKLCSYTCKFC